MSGGACRGCGGHREGLDSLGFLNACLAFCFGWSYSWIDPRPRVVLPCGWSPLLQPGLPLHGVLSHMPRRCGAGGCQRQWARSWCSSPILFVNWSLTDFECARDAQLAVPPPGTRDRRNEATGAGALAHAAAMFLLFSAFEAATLGGFGSLAGCVAVSPSFLLALRRGVARPHTL